MNAFRDWLAQLYAQLGYPQILLLMAMESSLLPVPSELVMIPAGYFARAGQLDASLRLPAVRSARCWVRRPTTGSGARSARPFCCATAAIC